MEDMHLIKGFLAGLKPVKKLTVSEWADKNRILTSASAARPGRWRTSVTPFLREIMDNLSPNSPFNEVIVMKGVQLGFTESGLNMIGTYADIAPCPQMYLMPTIEMAKGVSESRFDTMVENCESLSEKIRPPRERDSGNTKLKKEYPGGLIVFAGANSAASLRSRPMRNLVLDEVDGYPLSVDDEGSPVSLAKKRTSTYGSQKKIYMLSTPTVAGISVIEAEFELTGKRYYHVPCPHCGTAQPLKFENMRWTKGAPETVKYECEHCNELIEEHHKDEMLEHGTWIPSDPERERKTPNKRGYHINSLYSPLGWLSWKDIIEDFEKSQTDDNLLRTFVNTILGETWKESGEKPAWENLYNRRESYELYTPNEEVVFLTCGVDVQGDRIEAEVVGWLPDKRSYSITREIMLGDPKQASGGVWDDLAKFITREFVSTDGRHMNIMLTAVDTGYSTQAVYSFCNRFTEQTVIPVKGQDKQRIMVAAPSQVSTTKDGKKVGRVKVWNIGVSMIKSEIYGWLKLERNEHGTPPPGYMHFPEYDQKYFMGLTAETLKKKIIRGYAIYEWVKEYERNEPLDLRVYARAAANVVGLDRWTPEEFEYVRKSYLRGSSEPKQPRRRGGSYW